MRGSPGTLQFGQHVSGARNLRDSDGQAFVIGATTIGTQVGVLRMWLTVVGAVIGIALLVTVESSAWAEMLFSAVGPRRQQHPCAGARGCLGEFGPSRARSLRRLERCECRSVRLEVSAGWQDRREAVAVQ